MREDWFEIELNEITVFALGGDWGKAEDFQDENYDLAYCIRGAEFKNWDVDFGKTASLRKLKKNSIEKRNLVLGDILVEISGGGPEQPVGRTQVISQIVLNNFKDSKLVCTNFLRLIRLSKFIDSEFTNWYLKYFYSTGKIRDYQAGSNNLRNLKFSKYLTLGIPLAPLPEQRAIVAKIEELLSDLDKGVADLKKAQDQLKVYRQAILKKAFEGELTKEWRKKQTDLPSAVELLEQIKEERQIHYEQQIENWEQAVKSWEENGKEGKKPGKPKAKSSLPVLTKEEKSALPALSSSWSWIKLDQIGELFCGQSPSVSEVNKEGKGMLYVTGPEQWNGREIEEIKWTEFPKRIVPDGSIFITVKGAGVGKLFPGIHCAIGRDVYAFKPDTKINFKYVYHALKHSIDIVVMKALGDIPGLSKNHILDHYLGFCSQEEQHQIVQEIESRLSVCDKVEESITESLEKAEALRQSILKKAFEGNLLSTQEIEKCKTAPDYEPAAVLLEKIKMK